MLKLRHGLLTAFSCLVFLITIDAAAQVAGGTNADILVAVPASGVDAAVLPQEQGFSDAFSEVAAVTPTVPEDEEDDANVMLPAVAVPLNQKVLQYIQQFTTTRRRILEEGLARGARYLPMIQSIFREEGLPEELVYLPLIESAFRTNATSSAGASGIWQFMKGTATFNGLSRDWYIDERADPEKSTRAAARLLKTLYGMFGDWHLALAAYNAGGGRVQKAMKQSRKNGFWELSATTHYLPRETREYVPLFLASLTLARTPLEYGLNFTALEEPLYDLVNLTSPLDLRRVAEWVGTGVEIIQELNPELRRWTTPVRAAVYALKVPAGTGAVVEARLAGGTPADISRHVVTKGETLLAIARKLKVTRSDLAEANYLSPTATLRAGDTLIIPRPPTLTPTVDRPTLLALADLSHGPIAAAPSDPTTVVHRVQPGDTIDSIARAYRTSAAYLKEWNGMVEDGILPGMELTILSHDTSIH